MQLAISPDKNGPKFHTRKERFHFGWPFVLVFSPCFEQEDDTGDYIAGTLMEKPTRWGAFMCSYTLL